MKRVFFILAMSSIFFSISFGQTLLKQIEHAYSALDSVAYIDNVISSYAKSLDKEERETYQLFVDIFRSDNNSMGVAEGYHIADSLYAMNYSDYKLQHKQFLEKFKNDVKSSSPEYVLNLKMNEDHTLQVDTTKLAFNLFFLDKKDKDRLYVYCDDGEYSWQDSRFSTFSRIHGKNAPKVFKKIMRKHPKYILYCPDLEGMNTILYVIDKDIYVYRIIQMQEYTLETYIKNFYQ